MIRLRNELILSLPFPWLKVHIRFYGYYNVKHITKYPTYPHIYILYRGKKQEAHDVKLKQIIKIGYCLNPKKEWLKIEQTLPKLTEGESYFLSVSSCPKRVIAKVTKQLTTPNIKQRAYKIIGDVPLYLKNKYTSQEYHS